MDSVFPNAWRFRDYVINSFNQDKPYDQLVREHLAGDLLQKPRIHKRDGYNESIIATGWWFMHQATHAPVDVVKDEADRSRKDKRLARYEALRTKMGDDDVKALVMLLDDDGA